MPSKKDKKKLKIKVMRRGRVARPTQKKPNVKQIVNVYNTRSEPVGTDFRTDFRDRIGYTQLLSQPTQAPFAPVFNIQQPAPVPSMNIVPKSSVIAPATIAPAEVKPKRKYVKKPIVYGVAVPQSSFDIPSETEMFRQPIRAEESEVLARKKIKKMEEELRNQPSSSEFFTGNLSPIVASEEESPVRTAIKRIEKRIQKQPPAPISAVSEILPISPEPKRRGRPPKEKPLEVVGNPQPDIMQFFGKAKSSETNEI